MLKSGARTIFWAFEATKFHYISSKSQYHELHIILQLEGENFKHVSIPILSHWRLPLFLPEPMLDEEVLQRFCTSVTTHIELIEIKADGGFLEKNLLNVF